MESEQKVKKNMLELHFKRTSFSKNVDIKKKSAKTLIFFENSICRNEKKRF